MPQPVEVAVDPEQGVSDVFGAHAVADPARAFMDIVDIRSVARRPVALPRHPQAVPAERPDTVPHPIRLAIRCAIIRLL
jgi:hypothetical protein